MIVGKYPQSHLVIKGNNTKIIIDPGFVTFEKGFEVEEFQNADAYLVTHIHKDHIDYYNFQDVVGDAPVYGNPDVIGLAKGLGITNFTVLKDRQKFTVGEFEIEAINLPHCKMADGSEGPCNTGFLINGIFFHPGDGIELDNFTVDNLALPLVGPTINVDNAFEFAQNLKAKMIIPIHYHIKPDASGDLVNLSAKAKDAGIEVRILQDGHETTIE